MDNNKHFALAKSNLQFSREFLNPTIDAHVVDLHATLAHHFFQIPITQRVSQIPSDTDQDEGFFDAVAFEGDHVGSSERCLLAAQFTETVASSTNATQPAFLPSGILKMQLF
jgi:hypothetical protein